MPRMTVYGKLTCSDTQRSRKFLAERGVPYEWVDVERSPEGLRIAQGRNGGKLNTPTIVFDDGSVLIEPSDEVLARKLGL